MPFEGYLPAVIFSNDILPVPIMSMAILVRTPHFRLCTAEPLDRERIYPPSLSEPGSRNFSPVEFDGHVVDPYGWSREFGRMLDKRSESARTPYSAGELRPVVLFSGKTEGTCEIVFHADQVKEHETYRKTGSSLTPRRARQTCPRDRIPPP